MLLARSRACKWPGARTANCLRRSRPRRHAGRGGAAREMRRPGRRAGASKVRPEVGSAGVTATAGMLMSVAAHHDIGYHDHDDIDTQTRRRAAGRGRRPPARGRRRGPAGMTEGAGVSGGQGMGRRYRCRSRRACGTYTCAYICMAVLVHAPTAGIPISCKAARPQCPWPA